MKQEILDQLINDSFELHIYSDMSELAEFFNELADKYELHFDIELFNYSNNKEHYWNNI